MGGQVKWAVTGASGYVGSRLCEQLRLRGDRVLELRRDGAEKADCAPFTLEAGVSSDCLSGVDVLVHCAYDFSVSGWRNIERVNVTRTLGLFAAARAAAVRRILFVSSLSAYPGCRSLYGRAKLAVEERGGSDVCVIRPGLVYGTNAGGMVGALARIVATFPVVPLLGLGNQPVYFAHEDDLARLVEALAELEAPPPAPITAASEERWTFRSMLEALAAAQERRICLIPVPWRLPWAALKVAEAVGIRLRTRSDGLIGLVYQNPQPQFNVRELPAPVEFRPLDFRALRSVASPR